MDLAQFDMWISKFDPVCYGIILMVGPLIGVLLWVKMRGATAPVSPEGNSE